MLISRTLRLASLSMIAVPLLGTSCGGRSDILGDLDCLALGTCECRGPEDCPAGIHCVNGRCALPGDGGKLLGFGEPCTADLQCESGYCIPVATGAGKVCTQACTGTCPSGWDCKIRVGKLSVSLCAQSIDRLCRDCSVDGHCNPAFGDYCLALGGVQSCGRDCNYTDCPSGYECKSVDVGGHTARQCVPSAGTCQCTPQTSGLTRPCENANPIGTCRGQSVCQSDGQWGACSASTPAAEVCNGKDDDCDGLKDASDPDVDVSALAGDPPYPKCQKGAGPSCQGTWACQEVGGQYEWVCAAASPQQELCDGLDNDCDLAVDEDFVDAQGRYVHVEHCGTCATDCAKVLQNLETDGQGAVVPGAVACEVVGNAPRCVPVLCAKGFYPYPEGQPTMCHPLPSPQCRKCTSAADCTIALDLCTQLSDDQHASCLQACGTDSPYPGCTGQIGAKGCCPDHATCQLVAGARVCLPDSNTCECDADHQGVVRSCIVAGQQNAKCAGTQVCKEGASVAFDWSECDTVGTTDEVCDGQDNDCDGLVDEIFFNQKGSGTYDVSEHCGACNNDCTAKWNVHIQHAVGGCEASSSITPHCVIESCTTDSVGGGGDCRADGDCPAGWTCLAPSYQCAKACQAPADCQGAGVCHDGWCTIACTSGADCTAKFGAPSSCVAGFCEVDYKFVDVDKAESNGCECPGSVGSADDPPDIYGTYPAAGTPAVDRNCDGVDGMASAALYVWEGSTLSQGTREHPFRTIQEALAAYNPSIHRNILVATGQYHETVVLAEGVELYGGYSSNFASRDIVGYPTLILGPEPSGANAPLGVVNATGIKNLRTVVAGFAIYGFNVAQQAGTATAGRSTYGVYLKDCSDKVVIANNLIFGGRGGDGGHGEAGSAGSSGGAGQSGANAKECATASCGGETQQGGSAGTNPVCGGTAGNPGAGSNGSLDPQAYTSSGGLNGLGGTNARYSTEYAPQFANLCKYDCVIAGDLNGLDAQSGANGQTGAGGQGCAQGSGSVVAGAWHAGAASAGAAGTVGKGGGGGGAGGCVINTNPATCTVGHRRGDLGGTGGGGGAGGCGGGAGMAGGAGGGSFGLFVGFTSSPGNALPRIRGNIIYVGEGGAGGDGAYGGHGGSGGPGGFGGVATSTAWCAGYGGKGGRGGDGGPGGGAGGGCGGVAFGLAGNFIAAAGYETSNAFVQPVGATGGPGGSGGPSPAGGASNGTPGTNGSSGVTHVY